MKLELRHSPRQLTEWPFCDRLGYAILGDPGAVSRVGRKGETKVFKYVLENFRVAFSPTRLTAPGSPRMGFRRVLKKDSELSMMTMPC